jgi:GGDEF domain-containing protein
MNKKFITGYGIGAFLVLAAAIAWFSCDIAAKSRVGTAEAEKTFGWLVSRTQEASFQNGFMSDAFIKSMTETCAASRTLSTFVIETTGGTVFSWSDGTAEADSDCTRLLPRPGKASVFSRAYSSNLDLGNGVNPSVVVTATVTVLLPGDIFAASSNAFIVVLSLFFLTLIVILAGKKPSSKVAPVDSVMHRETEPTYSGFLDDTAMSMDEVRSDEEDYIPSGMPDEFDASNDGMEFAEQGFDALKQGDEPQGLSGEPQKARPEGLFSPVTGLGWEAYLSERLEAELVRAASSEQDLALIILRVPSLVHTDLVSRKIAAELLEVFRFRDMVFEFGSNGFAGILQNVNLDQAMKAADDLYSRIDGVLMDDGFNGQMTIGITTRTARLLPASRMIEEAVGAAQKALEEPNLPIVAFRANPDKYREFLAGNA